MWLFYAPVAAWVGALSIRYGGLSTITAANPGIPDGGTVGESKFRILSMLPPEWTMEERAGVQRLGAPRALREAPRAEVVAENADAILREVRSLQEFVTAFSAVAQLPEPKFGPTDLAELVEDAARLYRGSSPVEFRVEVERPVPLAWADAGQIQRVLVNLIKNAVEVLGDRGLVILRVRRDPDHDGAGRGP